LNDPVAEYPVSFQQQTGIYAIKKQLDKNLKISYHIAKVINRLKNANSVYLKPVF